MVVINDYHHHNPIRSSYQCLFMIIIDNPALIMIALMITTKKNTAIQLSSHNLIHSPDVVSRVVLGRVQICLNQVYP